MHSRLISNAFLRTKRYFVVTQRRGPTRAVIYCYSDGQAREIITGAEGREADFYGAKKSGCSEADYRLYGRTHVFFFFFPLCDCHDQEVCDKVVLLSELKKKSYSV